MKEVCDCLMWSCHLITIYDPDKTPQSFSQLFYWYKRTLDELLLSSRVLTNQTLTKIAVVDYQISVSKTFVWSLVAIFV